METLNSEAHRGRGGLTYRPAGRVLIAAAPGRAVEWRRHLGAWAATGEAVDYQQLETQLRGRSPDMVLLDLDLPRLQGPQAVQALLACHAGVRFLLVGESDGEAVAHTLVEAGAWGYLAHARLAEQLHSALNAIRKGEIWASRRTLSRVVSGQAQRGEIDAARAGLTVREREIAWLISRGMCQKGIAQALDISPHTVRNHTRHIFQKMGVRDRMQLALKIRGD